MRPEYEYITCVSNIVLYITIPKTGFVPPNLFKILNFSVELAKKVQAKLVLSHLPPIGVVTNGLSLHHHNLPRPHLQSTHNQPQKIKPLLPSTHI